MAIATADYPVLPGNRKFVWFTSRRRNPSEYESYTVGQLSGPHQWLDVGWPVRFDDGRPPYVEDSTAVRSSDWQAYRDPAQLWQRPYVAMCSVEEQALSHLVPAALQDGLVHDINATWRTEVMGKYLAAWPHVDYGLFLALSYATREALSDTVMFSIAFSVSDRLRHLQDVVQAIFQIQEQLPTFTDGAARAAWMEDPVLVPTRRNVELIASCRDWVEVLVATNLVFEPIVGHLAKNEFFARFASHNGDCVLPLILASARRDIQRHLESTTELLRVLLDDPRHAVRNGELISGWIERWSTVSYAAAEALGDLFSLGGITTGPFEVALERTRLRHQAILKELGLV
jgi:methane monooxygenase component A beta chain/propane monooxygenase small subunit